MRDPELLEWQTVKDDTSDGYGTIVERMKIAPDGAYIYLTSVITDHGVSTSTVYVKFKLIGE